MKIKSKLTIVFLASLVISPTIFAGTCKCSKDIGNRHTVVGEFCTDSKLDCINGCKEKYGHGQFISASLSPGECKIYNPGVILFSGKNYTGESIALSRQIADLTHSNNRFNDKTQSIKIRPGCTVTLCEHISYTGTCFDTNTDLPTLEGQPLGPNQISSLIVHESCYAR